MTAHGKKFSSDFEIFSVNDSFLDSEISVRIPRNAVARARNNQIQNSRERSEHRNGENIAISHVHLAAALHCSRVVAETGEIVRPAELAVRGFVVVVKIGQSWEIHTVDRQRGVITRIAVRQRNVGIAVYVPGKKSASKIDNLQMIVGEKKSSGDSVERQSLAEKNVIHPGRRIDIDLKLRARSAAKLISTVCRDCRRLTKFVRRDILGQIRIDPKGDFRRANIRFDVRNADFVFGKVVSKSSGANAFVAHDPEIFISDRAVRKMHFPGSAVHPLTAKPGAIERDVSVALPAFRMSIFSANSELNHWRARAFPFPKKFLYLRRDERPQFTRRQRHT